MFTADAHFKFGLDTTAFFYAHTDELAYAFLIKNFEGIGLDYAMLLIELEELGRIITREAECHLCEVVGTKREEVGNRRYFIGCKSRAGNFNHGAYEVGK